MEILKTDVKYASQDQLVIGVDTTTSHGIPAGGNSFARGDLLGYDPDGELVHAFDAENWAVICLADCDADAVTYARDNNLMIPVYVGGTFNIEAITLNGAKLSAAQQNIARAASTVFKGITLKKTYGIPEEFTTGEASVKPVVSIVNTFGDNYQFTLPVGTSDYQIDVVFLLDSVDNPDPITVTLTQVGSTGVWNSSNGLYIQDVAEGETNFILNAQLLPGSILTAQAFDGDQSSQIVTYTVPDQQALS